MKTFAITSNSELESQCCFLFFPLFCPCRHSSQYSHMYTYFCCSPWKSKKEKLRAFIYQWHYLKYPSPPRLTKIYLDPHISTATPPAMLPNSSYPFHLEPRGSPVIISITIFHTLVFWPQLFSFSLHLLKDMVLLVAYYSSHFKDIEPCPSKSRLLSIVLK